MIDLTAYTMQIAHCKSLVCAGCRPEHKSLTKGAAQRKGLVILSKIIMNKSLYYIIQPKTIMGYEILKTTENQEKQFILRIQ